MCSFHEPLAKKGIFTTKYIGHSICIPLVKLNPGFNACVSSTFGLELVFWDSFPSCVFEQR